MGKFESTNTTLPFAELLKGYERYGNDNSISGCAKTILEENPTLSEGEWLIVPHNHDFTDVNFAPHGRIYKGEAANLGEAKLYTYDTNSLNGIIIAAQALGFKCIVAPTIHKPSNGGMEERAFKILFEQIVDSNIDEEVSETLRSTEEQAVQIV